MSADQVEHKVNEIVVSRMLTLVNIKTKLEELYNPLGIDHNGASSVAEDIRTLEKSSFEEDQKAARELKERLLDIRDFIDSMIALPLDRESIREEADKRVTNV